MSELIAFSFEFMGGLAAHHEIDFYDAADALTGFQRTLALTTHLALNGEIITHAPSLKGATILSRPPEAGSWKTAAIVIGGISTAMYQLGTAPKDTPIGNMIGSLYDYVIEETLGFHVDYNKTLGEQNEVIRRAHPDHRPVTQSQADSLIEKCENSLRKMHRPLIASRTAHEALIFSRVGSLARPSALRLTSATFDYLDFTDRSEIPHDFEGRVTSYNINTFKGRIYILDELRPIPFLLGEDARDSRTVGLITRSLNAHALDRGAGTLRCRAFRDSSRTGRLKRLFIVEVSEE